MILIDTGILIALFKDRTGFITTNLQKLIDGKEYYLTRFTQMELLQGAYNDAEWLRLNDYLANQDYLEIEEETWAMAARLYYDLRRQGTNVRSVVSCCISEIAMSNDFTLLHNDDDFKLIGRARALKHIYVDTQPTHHLHDKPQQTLPKK